MRVPISWLKDYVETDLSARELADLLTTQGFEVEAVEETGLDFEGVVVARVGSVEPHPDADKLRLCQVDDGSGTQRVVCGAPNVRAGLTVAFARLGARVGDLEIKKAKIRGETSLGMICSARELGLSGDHEGIMELDPSLAPGVPLQQALGLGETVLEVAVTPNRPDGLSLVGIAREVAARTGAPLRMPPIARAGEADAGPGPASEGILVRLEAPAGCPRYSARLVRNVRVGPSPDWLARRLAHAGVRPINNVVDITNFVMLETGHPMHAFDRRQIEDGIIVVRWGREGESLRTLDGVEYRLTVEDVVIADPVKAVALGGIMGGEASGVSASTTDLVLEAAWFEPTRIRRTARRLKIHSESSHRFERGCDPGVTLHVLDRAAALLCELAGGTVAGGPVDACPTPFEPRRIDLRVERVGRMLGVTIPRYEIEAILHRLAFAFEEPVDDTMVYDPGTLRVVVPTFRPDVVQEIDLIEELARMYGYDRIPETPPAGRLTPIRPDPIVELTGMARASLAGLGLDEAVSFIFTDHDGEGSAALANPLSEAEGRLRTSLVDSLVKNLVFNLNRQNARIGMFEIGRVFGVDPDGRYTQEVRAGILVAGEPMGHWRLPSRRVDFYLIKGIVETLFRDLERPVSFTTGDLEATPAGSFFHPGRSSRLECGGIPVGSLGEAHPRITSQLRGRIPVVLAEIRLAAILGAPGIVRSPAPPSPYPRVQRDLAVLVPGDRPWDEIDHAIRDSRIPNLIGVELFDVFTGKSIERGRRSLAFSLTFQHPERTLTDADVEKSLQRLLRVLEQRFEATLRE